MTDTGLRAAIETWLDEGDPERPEELRDILAAHPEPDLGEQVREYLAKRTSGSAPGRGSNSYRLSVIGMHLRLYRGIGDQAAHSLADLLDPEGAPDA